MRPIRNYLREMGIPVEGTKGEAEAGQEELNIKYADVLSTADHHTLAKHGVKEIAHQPVSYTHLTLPTNREV